MTWKVYSELDFMKDRIKIHIIDRRSDGVAVVQPVQVILQDTPSDVELTSMGLPEPAVALPMELARALFSSLAPFLVGVPDADLVREIERLRSELRKANYRLDKLISGIGRLGEALPGD